MTFADSLWISLPRPAFLIDGDDRIAEVSPGAEDFLMMSNRALRGQPVFDVLAIDAPLEDAFARVRQGRASLSINDADVGGGIRAPRLCNVQIAPMAGMPDHVLIVIEPRQLGDRFTRALGAKSAAKSAIGMAEMLSHEIKNPLAGIAGAAQYLAMNIAREDREMCDLIVAETRRISALLDQVEQFGNLRPPQRKAINIHDLLDRARKTAKMGFAARMTFVEEFDPSLPPTFVDGDQMLQVFQNLLKNASEAAGEAGGTITLRTFYDMSLRLRRKDATRALPLQVEVIDDGPGLPEDLAQDVFEPFVSGRENGTGLGLALVSKIVADHDGWIAVESVPGRTAFRISLPVVPDGPDEGRAP